MSDGFTMCIECGKRPRRTKNQPLCGPCVCKKRYYSPGVKERDVARLMRNWEARKASGLCASGCGKPPATDRVMCHECKSKNNALSSQRKARLNASGLCRDCGLPVIDNKVVCEVCMEKSVVHNYRSYGLTRQQMIELRARAKIELCCICGRPASDSCRKTLAIDHSHIEPPTFRGLICNHCNSGLGHFFDSPSRLRAAAEYLERTDPRYQPKPESE